MANWNSILPALYATFGLLLVLVGELVATWVTSGGDGILNLGVYILVLGVFVFVGMYLTLQGVELVVEKAAVS